MSGHPTNVDLKPTDTTEPVAAIIDAPARPIAGRSGPVSSNGFRHQLRDFAQSPMNIYWEMTQACGLACRHCRMELMDQPGMGELTEQEGIDFLRQIPGFGDPLPQLILTGGDPLLRPDLYRLMDEAKRLGISVSITPAATPLLTRETLEKLALHGLDGLGLSLDAPEAEWHDSIRNVPGTFRRTLDAMRWAGELHLPLQVNTVVSAETAPGVPALYELLKQYPVARWSLFFLIEVGRGKVLGSLKPEDADRLMEWVYETAKTAPFVMGTTEAPSYRRVAVQKMKEEGLSGEEIKRSTIARGFGIRDGNGIVFVSSSGDICPAGFLPVPAGNVRTSNLVDVYRHAPLFEALHHPETFHGRCGACEYHTICGGSRSRAYSATGDALGSDPLCDFLPRGVVHNGPWVSTLELTGATTARVHA